MFKRIMEILLIVAFIALINGIVILTVQENTDELEGTRATETTIIQPTIQNKEQEEEKQEETKSYFDSNITFSKEYVNELDVMPYALFTPSTEDIGQKRPLIVWLHGLGEKNVEESAFMNSGILPALTNSGLEGFDGYILCPHLRNPYNTGVWNHENTKRNLEPLLEQFISTHNVDTEKIFIMGHSLGGQGALYFAHELPNYFSKCIVLSGYRSGVDNSEIEMPTIGLVGKSHRGEDKTSIQLMELDFVPAFGRENIFYLDASHAEVPAVAYKIDANGNNRSDIIEWLLGELEEFDNGTIGHTPNS